MAAGVTFYTTVGPSGTGTNSNPSQSLGGATYTTSPINATSLGNLFDNISASEASNGGSMGGGTGLDVRAISIKNTGTLTLYNIKIYGGGVGSGVGSSANTKYHLWVESGTTGTGVTVANETTDPAGQNFAEHSTEGTAITVSALNVNGYIRLWIKRHCIAGALALSADTKTITIKAQVAS